MQLVRMGIPISDDHFGQLSDSHRARNTLCLVSIFLTKRAKYLSPICLGVDHPNDEPGAQPDIVALLVRRNHVLRVKVLDLRAGSNESLAVPKREETLVSLTCALAHLATTVSSRSRIVIRIGRNDIGVRAIVHHLL